MRRLVAGSFVAGFVVAAALQGAGARAAETATVGIRPAAEEASWFRLRLYPGNAAEETALVVNNTGQRQRVLVYAVDATTTPQGAFALRERGDERKGIGAWVDLGGVTEMTLPPRTATRLPFRLRLPSGVAPGDYAGGVVVERAPVSGRPSDVGRDLSVQVNIVERVGVRLYLNVAGTAIRKVEAGQLRWTRTSDGLRFTLPLRNSGNVTVTPRVTLRIEGRGAARRPLSMRGPESILPGAQATFVATWRDAPQLVLAKARAIVELDGMATEAASADANVRIVPWPWAAAVAGGLALLALAVWRIARFYRRARVALRALEAGPAPAPDESSRRPIRYRG